MLKLGAIVALVSLLAASSPSPVEKIQNKQNHQLPGSNVEIGALKRKTPPSGTHRAVQIDQQNYNSSQYSGHGEQQPGWFGIPYEGVLDIATWFLFFATAGLFLYTAKLWTATKSLIAEERANASRELRAYISAMPLKAALKADNRTILVVVYLQNTGKTPAIDTKCSWVLNVSPTPARGDRIFNVKEDDPTKVVPNFVLYPNATHTTVREYSITDPELANINAGTHSVCAFGRVTYLDAFGAKQWSEFSHYMDKSAFELWLANAKADTQRRPIDSLFKFAEGNNRGSFV